jgi:hypothetical protein
MGFDGMYQQRFGATFDKIAQVLDGGPFAGFDQALRDQVEGPEGKGGKGIGTAGLGRQQGGDPGRYFRRPGKIPHGVKPDGCGRERRMKKQERVIPARTAGFGFHSVPQLLVAFGVDDDDGVPPGDRLRDQDFKNPGLA